MGNLEDRESHQHLHVLKMKLKAYQVPGWFSILVIQESLCRLKEDLQSEKFYREGCTNFHSKLSIPKLLSTVQVHIQEPIC